MAIDVLTQHESDYLYLKQTAWGTAVTTSMRRLNCEPTDFDLDVQHRLQNRAFQQRIRPREAFQVDYKGSMPGIQFRSVVRRGDLVHKVFSVMQDLTAHTGSTPNFQKVFKFPLTQPDFTASPDFAWYGTFFKKNPLSARNKLIKDAIGRRLRIFCKEGSGPETRLQDEWDVVGRGAPILNQANEGGTTTTATESQFDFYDIKVLTIEGVSTGVIIQEFDLEIVNNAFKIGVDQSATNGSFLTWGLNPYDATLKLKLAWTPAANDLQATLGTETDHTVVLSWGATGVAGFLEISGEFQFGPITDDDGEKKSVDLTGKLLTPTGVSAVDSLRITICDDQDLAAMVN